MATATDDGAAHNFWRRALHALGQAFDPVREGLEADTVFQPRAAHARAERMASANTPAGAVARRSDIPTKESRL